MTSEESRPRSPLEYENGLRGRGIRALAGVDEVGRGPLAGPVVAAAVILPEGCLIEGAGDSKTLSAIRRESLCREILARAAAVGIGAASVREIDQENIAVATARAMARALQALSSPPDHVVVDGLPVRRLGWKHEAVVGGDGLIHSIGCASIVAKVHRDRLMRRLAQRYPAYGWATNVGYGTPEHMQALREFGPSPHHRLTFGGVQLEMGLEVPDQGR
ncbi:MAG: ribonuclease HII [Gemmatimonadales bacterium]|jgi:ribonuclease HII|nr:MAG: ribonuclease HII [Gemmatimonadales bacterium]